MTDGMAISFRLNGYRAYNIFFNANEKVYGLLRRREIDTLYHFTSEFFSLNIFNPLTPRNLVKFANIL